MKKIYRILVISILSLNIHGQTPVLRFDGIDDYINFGPDAADNARTIEFWFNLSSSVDASLQNEILLFGTEIPNPNVDEWHLSITQSGTINPAGTLRFVYVEDIGQVSQVYSNDNSWESDTWYHVAVVIDTIQGMILFVDGVKQNKTAPSFKTPLTSNNANVEFGRQEGFNRYFEGSVDDLRVSAEALYLENFTPPCPDLMVNNSTIGLWSFNNNSGSVADDSGPNGFDGQIFGAIWDTANICTTTNIDVIQSESIELKIYPNPSLGEFNVEVIIKEDDDLYFMVYDIRNRLILNQKLISDRSLIDLSNKDQGFYYYLIKGKHGIYHSGKILKN